MLLFLDTETTGLFDFKLPLDHPHQPHLVELAAYLAEDDDDATHIVSLNCVIRPDGWQISSGAIAIHGITNEYARSFGEPLADVIARFYAFVRRADEESPGHSRLIAHNLNFDSKVLARELLTCGHGTRSLNFLLPFCTMRALTPRIRLPSRRGRPGEYKWPTLDEAYRFCYDREIPTDSGDRHRAMTDLLACRDIFTHGRREGWWT